MAESLRVLILEDRPEDAELMVHELRRAGYEPDWKCVAAGADFAACLSGDWDVILADYVLPEFNAAQALQLMRERGVDVPFILVTGSVGEEIAVACMQAGAADYVLKDRLARLGPAVRRALERKRARDERREALAALRESEAKLRTVFHSSADLITIADLETGVYVDVNDGFLEATGYARDEVIGKTGDDLHLWLEPAQRREVARRVSEGQEVRNEEVWFRKKDGTPFIGLLTAEGVQVAGRPCLLCVVRDITERKRVEAEAEQRRLFLESLFSCAPDAIVALDAQARVVEWNSGAEALFGYTRDEALGRHIDDLVAHLDPAIRSQALRFTEQLLRGEPIGAREIMRFRKDGSPVTVIAAGAPIVMEGKTVGIVAVYTDITARKRMEEALRDSERRYQALAEMSPVGIFRTDAQGKTTYVNPRWSQISGAGSQEALGNGWIQAVHPEDRDRILSGWRQAVHEGAASTAEYRFLRPNGTVAWVMGLAVPEVDDQGNVVGYVGTITDITERKRMEEALRESETRNRIIANLVSDYAYIFRVTAEGRLIGEWITESFTKVFGLTKEEIDARGGWESLVLPEDLPLALAHARKVAGGQSDVCEMRWVRASGEVRWLRDYAQPVFDPSGKKVVRIYGAAQDITERKMAEEELRRRAEELAALNRLGMALAETLDLPYIYDNARQSVAELVDAPVFGISLYDAETRTLRAGFMWSEGVALDASQFPPLTMPEDAAQATRGRAKAILTAQPEMVESLPDAIAQAADKAHHIGPPGDNRQALSAAYIPMTVEGKVIGLLEVQSYREKAYTEEDIALLQTVANQVGLSIQNARLFRQLQEHAAELERSLAELQQAQEALRESEARFRSLVESMDDIVFTLDREGRRTGVFGRWLQKYGTPPEMYLGKSTRDVLGPEAARVHEEANARALAGENVVYEWSAPGADGLRYFQTSLSPLYGPDRQVVGIVGVGRDITALKRAEEALHQSEERYRALVNLSPDGIWVHRYGEVLFTNDAAVALFGARSADDLIGKQTLDFIAPEMREMVGERIRRGMEERVPAPLIEEKLLRLDGTEFYADVLAVPIEWGGEPAVQVIIRDCTARKQMEERLLQAQKMEVVGRLAGGVAHDFNNILTAINGYASFALDSLPRGDPVRADVEQILASAERAANLTRQLLAFSRRQMMEQRVVNLNDLILNLDKMLRRLIGEDIELVTIQGEDLAPVKADPGQIEQVIVNLAVNARDAMPDGGKLIIETANVTLDDEYVRRHPGAEPGDYVLLAVTDTGVGMTDEVKAHLFEPFFTTKEPGKGTGLGLATVYGIVKQHGGNIYAYSEPGKGTTFKIYLPAVEAEAERLPRRDEDGFVPRGTETVLVVEDEANVRAIVTRTLTEQGYTVLEAANGYEALRLAREHAGEIHLLLADVVMPQMGGKELSERFSAIRPGVKTLFMSGYTDNAIVHRGVLDPGVAFLQKPFTAAALVRKVRRVLDMD